MAGTGFGQTSQKLRLWGGCCKNLHQIHSCFIPLCFNYVHSKTPDFFGLHLGMTLFFVCAKTLLVVGVWWVSTSREDPTHAIVIIITCSKLSQQYQLSWAWRVCVCGGESLGVTSGIISVKAVTMLVQWGMMLYASGSWLWLLLLLLQWSGVSVRTSQVSAHWCLLAKDALALFVLKRRQW